MGVLAHWQEPLIYYCEGVVPESERTPATPVRVILGTAYDRLARQHAGAVQRLDDLRATLQNVLDEGYNYPDEYRWSLQEALDADAKRGQSDG